MIAFIRFKDIPQFVVGAAISMGFLLILMPVWIANPSLLGSPTTALIQIGFIVIISLIAAGPITRWLRQRARSVNTTLRATEGTPETKNSNLLSDSSARLVPAPPIHAQSSMTAHPLSKPPNTAQAPAAVASELAQRIGDAFSSSRFTQIFGSETFSGGWTLDDGLAVWHFLGIVSLDAAVWTTFESKEQSLAIRDASDRLLSKRWTMSRAFLIQVYTFVRYCFC